ncbi:hypothetical protein MBCUT_07500 [Methanobrevibacter cuticularis]|uniref:Probable [NiFe]-hydrogenase-type-3 Eha complex membrane subunit A n=1 Tax=Methanobrevibacter cuticularis TaxID=47311 RepID=A0A166EFM1_9EURY|nr:energy-converting hydrogenase A subunit A EhaA [Methanobrevibacter cuticularis]KZX16596.1 hypothetical protein MBCUT_07500 [Methanobrevibacter cuticularis]
MIIHVSEIYLFIDYLIAIAISIIIALGLRLPLLPNKPIRFSFETSALFPTPVIAIGLLAICFSLNIYWIYDGMVLAILLGGFSALFTKYLFDYVFPKPPEVTEDSQEVIQ